MTIERRTNERAQFSKLACFCILLLVGCSSNDSQVPVAKLYPAQMQSASGVITIGYIDANGVVKISGSFEEGGRFVEGLASVRVNGKYGFVDGNGKLVIEAKYADVEEFADGLAAVREERGKWGYIDKSGNIRIRPQFAEALPFSNGLAAVKRQASSATFISNCEYIGKEGQVVIPARYAGLRSFGSDVAIVLKGAKSGPKTWGEDAGGHLVTINKEGKELFDIPSCDYCGDTFHDGLLLISRDGKKGFLDTSGKWTVPPKYAKAAEFSEGRAAVEIDGKWGYIDNEGKLRVDPIYSFSGEPLPELAKFHSGLVYAESGEWHGYLDKDGKRAITVDFKGALGGFDFDAFDGELASAVLYDAKGSPKMYVYINKIGREVFRGQF